MPQLNDDVSLWQFPDNITTLNSLPKLLLDVRVYVLVIVCVHKCEYKCVCACAKLVWNGSYIHNDVRLRCPVFMTKSSPWQHSFLL